MGERRRRLAIPPLSARYCPPDSHRDGIHPGTPTRCFGIPGYRPLACARCSVFQTLFLIYTFGRRFNIIYVFGKKMYLERSDGILLAVNATRRE